MTVTIQFAHRAEAGTANEAFDILRNELPTTITGFQLINNLSNQFSVDGGWRLENALTFWQWVNGRDIDLTDRPFISMTHVIQQRCFKVLLSEIDNNINLLNQWTDTFFSGTTALCINDNGLYTFMGVA